MGGFSTEVAVVGAGISGLSTAYALRRRGVDFRVFEAAVPGAGQSAGRTRIFRHGHDDERLIRLAVRAREEWERLEAELGVRLLGRQGVLVCGPNVSKRAAAFEAAGVPARLVGPHEQVAALPLLERPGESTAFGEALLDELGGAIDVRAAIDGLAGAARDRLVAAQVFHLRQRGGGVELQTSEGIWRAQRAIVCPGAQVAPFAEDLGLHIPLTVELHTRVTFNVREPGAPLACLLDRSGVHGEIVYAAPMPDGRQYAVGLGGEHERPVQEAIDRLRAYVERALPGLDPEPAGVRLCWTSILPWSPDAFGAWRRGNVTLLAGANLFKFGPLLGELLADGSDELDPEPSPAAGMTRTIPALPVRDVGAAVAHYRDRFGFEARHEEAAFAVLVRDDAALHLWGASDEEWRGRSDLAAQPVCSGAESFIAGTASCRIEVADVDALFRELQPRGVLHDVSREGVAATDFGTREFATVDLDGNLLTFFRWEQR